MHKNHLRWAAWTAIAFIVLGAFAFTTSTLAARDSNTTLQPDANSVPNGTHFLVRLDNEVNTGKDKVNRKFHAKTLEPLETSNGYILRPGANVHGHISRIEPAGSTGRARVWLTFDDIDTHHRRLPLVAEVSSVPGDFGVRSGESKEGEIEAPTYGAAHELEAAAAGAVMGAAAGASAHGVAGAASGAVSGGAAAFAASSGIGQELDLPKGTKLDLVLDRPLHLNQ